MYYLLMTHAKACCQIKCRLFWHFILLTKTARIIQKSQFIYLFVFTTKLTNALHLMLLKLICDNTNKLNVILQRSLQPSKLVDLSISVWFEKYLEPFLQGTFWYFSDFFWWYFPNFLNIFGIKKAFRHYKTTFS